MLRACILLLLCALCQCTENPSIVVVILARNAAGHLGPFLSHLEAQDYPKRSIRLWIRADKCLDNTIPMLQAWSRRVELDYAEVVVNANSSAPRPSSPDWHSNGECDWRPHCWTTHRFHQISLLREAGLVAARLSGADMMLSLDTDVFLINPSTISLLVAQKRPIVAPLVHSVRTSWEANFFGAVDSRGYYKQSSTYFPTMRYKARGNLNVPVVHSVYLVDLRTEESEQLSYLSAEGEPVDDVVIFGLRARAAGIQQVINNQESFGLMLPYQNSETTYLDDHKLVAWLEQRYLSKASPMSSFLLDEMIPALAQELHRDTQAEFLSTNKDGDVDQKDDWHSTQYAELCSGSSTKLNAAAVSGVPATETCSFAQSGALRYSGIGVEHAWSEDLHVTLFHNLVTDEEVEWLKQAAMPSMGRSVVHNVYTGEQTTAEYRTQNVTWLEEEDGEVVRRINSRIRDVTGLSLESAESLQVGMYDTNGGEYEPHFDWHQPNFMAKLEARNSSVGNRLATMLLYLSDGHVGGHTVFTRAGLSVRPTKNTGVFWYNLKPSGEPSMESKHAGCPAFDAQQSKWVSNKWFHELGNEQHERQCKFKY